MTKTTELNPARSERYRYLETFRFLPLLIILCSITLIAAILSWFRAERLVDENKDLKAIVVGLQTSAGLEQTMYKETERECRIAQAEIDNFKIVLIRAGLDIKHEGEKP